MAEEETETSDFEEALASISAADADPKRDFQMGEVEEEEDYEEGEDDIEDGEYTLRFEGEMNPLDFTEDDAFGVQPYQQFERLEYEALAERKRKALDDSQCDRSAKKSRQEDVFGASIDEIMESLNLGKRRKSRKPKKRGRRKGSKNKLSPEVTRKLGDATLHYAFRRYEEAICVLKEVVRLAPNLPDPYHTLGLVYNAVGDNRKALNFYMIAAHLTPKDPSLWKLLVTWSIAQGNTGQARYCLSKAITADPEDMTLRFDRASLYIELGDYQKAAESYDQILGLCPKNVEACKMAAKMYQKCGQVERSVSILEAFLKDHPTEADLSVVNLLAAIYMENNTHNRALQQIEHARSIYCLGEELPLYLTVKAGICQVHLGNMEMAEILFRDLQLENGEDNVDLITEVADSFMSLGHYESALKYYLMLEGGNAGHNNGFLHLKISHCFLSLKERARAISFFYEALRTLEDNIDARLTLASLLLEEGKEDEAILLLSPPKKLESTNNTNTVQSKPWWHNGKVKMQLSRIYHAKGMLQDFVDTIFSSVRESLFIETMNQKVRTRKRLSRSVLFERVKVLDDHQTDNVFRGFRPIATASDLLKAARAKKSLQKKAALKEEKKAAALAAGLDWQSDDSDDEPKALRESPLPKLLKDEDHYRLIVDLCKALASLQRYWEALEIINHSLRLAYNTMNTLSVEKKEELRSLGAQIASNTTDPTHGYDCARYIVQQHPYSFAAWNCYYKVISRLENRFSKHSKFLHSMRCTHKDCVPPMIIFGHQLTSISQHQAAAREYLEAYKLLPDSPLINLCVGTALINLALGFRLQNKHQCLTQGFAFLYNNLRLSENSQEALYNIARAYQHVGLVSLAASYYEKVLAIHEKDYPILKLPSEHSGLPENQKPGYCNLRKEAAYNLHLIYKKSGALDLARQVLKDHCTP